METRDDRFDERDRARFDGNRAALDAAAGWRSGESVLRVERAAAKSFGMDAGRLAASPAQSIGCFRLGARLAVLMRGWLLIARRRPRCACIFLRHRRTLGDCGHPRWLVSGW